MNSSSLFKWRHYQPEVILLCIRWYLSYPLSYRQVAEMVNERGMEVDHTGDLSLGTGVQSRNRQAG